MASPLNPVVVPAVTYEYLFFLRLSDRLRSPTRWKARGLLTGSCTPGYHGSPVMAQKFGYAQYPLATNVWETKYFVLDMVSAILAEEEGPPTSKE
jgi:hypothetical protein